MADILNTTVLVEDSPPPRSGPPSTGKLMVVGTSLKGPTNRTVTVNSTKEWQSWFGGFTTTGTLFDPVDVAFRCGVTEVTTSRVVGPAAAQATINIPDRQSTPGVSLVVKATGPGAYANGMKVRVDDADPGVGTSIVQLVILDSAGVELERSPVLTSRAQAVSFGLSSAIVDVTLGNGADEVPPTGATVYTLAGGADDLGSLTDADWALALARIGENDGPGQVWAPGRTTAAAHQQILTHCHTFERVAMLDAADGISVTALKALAASSRALGSTADGLARHGELHASWVIVPDPALTGRTRTVSYNAVRAGRIAIKDRQGNPNEQPLGAQGGQAPTFVTLTRDFTDAERSDLGLAGVNTAKTTRDGVFDYGMRTLADPAVSQSWVDWGNARLTMAIAWDGKTILEGHRFKKLVPKTFDDVKRDLTAMLNAWFLAGALYSENGVAAEAYRVDTGDQVNTPTTIAARELHAGLVVRESTAGETLFISISKTPVDQAII
jgi:hypothetical protein